LVFTRRAWHLRSHTGEVSFPGGRFEPGDADLAATALRESHEEIGLDPVEVEVVGELDRLTTVSSPALIVPYVGAVNGEPAMVGSPDEVDAIIRVPVAELLQPDIYRCEIWPWPDGGEIEITFFELVGDTLWGATARMVRNFLETVLSYAEADG
jgi:8-oxo-dGTP pyrophosphatase MutT (NUDIX family)